MPSRHGAVCYAAPCPNYSLTSKCSPYAGGAGLPPSDLDLRVACEMPTMNDKRMELLTLLSPGPAHAAEIGLLAADLGVGPREVEKLIAQLQASRFQVIYEQDHVWIDWAGWPRAQQAAEDYLLRHPD